MEKETKNYLEKNKRKAERIKKYQYIKKHTKEFIRSWKYKLDLLNNPKYIGILSKTPKCCNCCFCKNPRKAWNELTKQEKVSNEIFKDSLNELKVK